MSLNHDVQSPPRENYVNGCINDFTDCIDFTKQYQKSCGFEEDLEVLSDIQGPVGDLKSKNTSGKCTQNEHRNEFGSIKPDSIEKASVDFVKDHNGSLKIDKSGVNNDVETDFHPMEPDVSITIGESNLEKTISQVATGSQVVETGKSSPGVGNSNNFKKKISKQKLIKKNHLKLPVNKSVKKKVSLFKFKNGKHVKKKNESFQYQGVQSNIKFKCYKCSYSDLSTISELQSHQRKCLSGTAEFQSINESSSVSNSPSSNFRITRKVYLCSACGSYYENWNLFLHMKEMHKRHICLYCLGMFSQPDKLAQHLQTKHNVIEQSLSTTDEFLKVYRGTCYLTCISCEAMFSEQENFYEHSCMSAFDDSSSCPLCGLQGAHFPTCRRGFSDRYLEPEYQRSHPALGKKLNAKKKKLKSSKKPREMFQIVNNENSGEMSVIVRKQPSSGEFNENGTDTKMRENTLPHKDSNDSSVMMSALRNTNDLISSKQYNEKLIQLYRPGKTSEKVVSSIQSIEDSINRVVENLRMTESSENDTGKNEGEEAESDINCDAQEKESLINEKDEFPSLSESNLPPALFRDSVKSVADADRNADDTEELSNSLVENEENEVENGFVRQKKINENLVVSECESTDSEKLTIAFDQPSEQYFDRTEDVSEPAQPTLHKSEENIPTAPKDTSYIHVSVVKECENELKKLIKEFVKVSCWNCVYCSHAKRIALNGKQLVLHILAEHRFVIVPEDSSEEEKEKSASDIIQRLKSNLHQLETVYFNSDTFDSENKELWKVSDRIYECFHCLFATYVHKELCSHNRKMHQKAMFLCIMCKSNFYTYSELLCHLCPGIYVSGQVINPDITYRCFLCDVEPLPSSFRLMVHLRRKHNSCDICFDQSANQFQLSTHVWKHKLSHMCYRCGIAYRNKPDITKHLFWKHGTESVLCKKCLQKKWPHVYHFCVPPNNFICDECSATLKSAVALKVHKRLHSEDYPYSCTKCEEKFISRKLLEKHLDKHEEKIENLKDPDAESEPPETESNKNCDQGEEVKTMESEVNCSDEADKKPEKEKKTKKKKVMNDVFDLPPVNLSESDDSDTEEPDIPKVLKPVSPCEEETPSIPNGYAIGCTQKEEPSPTQIVDGVWNNFQNYLVAKDMPKTFKPPSPFKNMTLSRIKEIMLSDHDYHIIPNFAPQDVKELTKVDTEKTSTEKNKKAGLDHDYCNNIQKGKMSCKSKQKIKEREDASKSSSSDSSSDSDSSCSCGSNCSCSSGSSSSTSSNDSDSDSRGKKRTKKVEKESNASVEVPEPPTEVDISVHDTSNENLIRESDLDTDETETDEDFYDYNPAREANRILAEKRTQLLANLNGSETVTSSPTVSSEKPASPKKKAKIKKKRSQARSSAASKSNRKKSGTFATAAVTAAALNRNRVHQVPTETVATNSIPNVSYESPSAVAYARLRPDVSAQSPVDGDAKRPKRKRVPLKFYGFSSDDESDVTPTSKKREKGEHNTTTPAPQAPITHETSANGTPALWNPHSRGSLSWRIEKSDANTPKVNPIKIRTSQSGGKVTPTVENPSEGGDLFHLKRNFQVNGNPVAQKGEKLYCFCQCPYDEVSEMIACDAEDCLIEWFHFECVGIMVPPKGSWYCPDCRKKLAAEHEFMSPPTTDPILN